MSGDHWPRLASIFSLVGPPLRPNAEDLDAVRRVVDTWQRAVARDAPTDGGRRDGRAPRVLIMGATTELYDLPWPHGSDVVAVDRHQAALDAMWPGDTASSRCCDWRDLCLPDESRDIAVCDGGLGLLEYPAGVTAVATELTRVLTPGGLFVARLYVPGPIVETPDDVIAATRSGAIPSVNHLKMRMWFALQRDAETGVALSDVWNTIRSAIPDLETLAESLGWPVESLRTIEPYRSSNARYHLATQAQIVSLFRDCIPRSFELTSGFEPTYEMGTSCPTIVFRKL